LFLRIFLLFAVGKDLAKVNPIRKHFILFSIQEN